MTPPILAAVYDKIDRARADLASVITCRGLGCSACCRSDVMAHPEEVRAMLPHVGAEAWARVRDTDATTLEEFSATCPLLDPVTRGCTVYAVRPAICRSYAVVTPPEWCDVSNGPREIASPAVPVSVARDACDNYLPGGIARMDLLVNQLARAKRARSREW